MSKKFRFFFGGLAAGILVFAFSAVTEANGQNAGILASYKGPVVKGVDATTLDGKVMCGYQGWFGSPGDGSPDADWRHWTKHKGSFSDDNAKVDLWPDVSELTAAERFSTGFKLPDGSRAEVFSAYVKPTVLRHFKWMQDYGIDGVFVQRFANSTRNARGLNFSASRQATLTRPVTSNSLESPVPRITSCLKIKLALVCFSTWQVTCRRSP